MKILVVGSNSLQTNGLFGSQQGWHGMGSKKGRTPFMITWVITFLLLAVVFSVVGFFGTDPGFVGQSACILAAGFFVFALIILFRNHKHHRIH
ncbi:MAG TPA: hypothetical protein VNW30_10490 [Opitutaceae bacterium]|nr:hypothetical protein [Opitutaceae bacterium]